MSNTTPGPTSTHRSSTSPFTASSPTVSGQFVFRTGFDVSQDIIKSA